MSWARIEDTLPDHPKMWAMGNRRVCAMFLYVFGVCFCARNLTDGRIPKHVLHTATRGAETTCKKMVDVGLLQRDGDFYLLKDYLEYNPSREQVMSKRKRHAQAQARYRDASRGASQGASVIVPPTPIPKEQVHIAQKRVKEKVGDEGFEEWWILYGKKVDKQRSLAKWNAAIKSGATPETITAGTRRYLAYCKENDRLLKDPATFLNQRSWEDEWATKKKGVEW